MLKNTQVYPNAAPPTVSGNLTSVNEPDTEKGYTASSSNDEAEKKSLKGELLEMVRDCGDRSSIHSLPSFASRNVPFLVKVVWIICVLISWGYFGYQIYGVVNLYLSYSVVSAVSIGYEAPTDFPTVDICNLNPFDGYKITDYMNDIIASRGLDVVNFDTVRSYTDEVSNDFKAYFQYLRLTNQLQGIPDYYYGFLLSDILISCEYQGVVCSASDFYWFYDYNYGNCYRFNGLGANQSVPTPYAYHATRKSSKAGWRNGLMLELYTGDQGTQQEYTYKTGLRVIVHNQSVIPFPDEDGIDVAVGLQTNVAISRTFYYRLPSPYSNCIDELSSTVAQKNDILQEMYNQKQSGKISDYQQNYCLKLCYQNYIMRTCNCSDLSLAALSSTLDASRGCISVSQTNCTSYAELSFYSGNDVNTCYDSCPIECNSIDYDVQSTTASYPTEWYATLMNENKVQFHLDTIYYNNETNSNSTPTLTQSLIASTTAMVNVFYDSMQYTVIDESPSLTFDLLIANIGGNLGLFTGMSILSFVELLEMILSAVIIVYFFKKK